MPSDLHLHTTFSDGRLTPENIVLAAKKAGLAYIAITDHDTLDGIRHLYEAGLYPGRGIKIIPGIEFSAHNVGHEIHILGYNIDIFNTALQEKLDEVVEGRWTRFSRIIEKLQELGYPLKEADVLKIAAESKSISRSHIGQALVQRGFFPTVGAAFDELLHKNGPAYVSHYRLTVAEIIGLIKGAGGIAVLAHPKLVGDDALVEEVIAAGIEGLEVFYPQHSAADTLKYQQLAEKQHLLLTGGSDYHAIPSRYPQQLGEFTIEDGYAAKIYQAVK